MRKHAVSKTKPTRRQGPIAFTPQQLPQFRRVFRPISIVFPVKMVFARTSAPAALRLPPTFAAASQQNAAASPPLADTRLTSFSSSPFTAITSHQSQVTPHLIYGTGIKKLRKPTPINEYKLLIYGKPRCSRLSFPGAMLRKFYSSPFTAPCPNHGKPSRISNLGSRLTALLKRETASVACEFGVWSRNSGAASFLSRQQQSICFKGVL